MSQSTKVKFDCFLNYKTQNEIKLGFTYYNLVMSNDSKRIYDLKVYKVHNIHEQEPSINGQTPNHVSVSDIVIYGDGMNILHYSEKGSIYFHYLGNMATRKFRAFNIHVKLIDPTEKYHTTSDVPVEDLLNRSLYYKGQMPYFEFELDGNTKTAICELTPVEEEVTLEEDLANTKAQVQIQRTNTMPVEKSLSVEPVRNMSKSQMQSSSDNRKNFLVL